MKTQNTLVFKTEKEFKTYLKGVNLMPTAFNRAVNENHSNKMLESLKEIKLQRAITVIRTSAFGKKDALYIADGQHLRKAILKSTKNLGGHLVVFENTIKDIEQIIPFVSRMNATAKNWSSKNYLDAWTTQGLEPYKILTEKLTNSKHTLNVILEAYVVNLGRSGNKYKNGKIVVNEARGNTILRVYEEACKLGLYRSTTSAVATARFLKSTTKKRREFYFYDNK